MEYEEFVAEFQRRAGPISRGAAETVVTAYLETLRELLPEDTTGKLATRLPNELAGHLEGGDESEEFSVWEFYERFAQKAGIGPEHATRYAGGVMGEVMTDEELEAARGGLPPEH